MTTHPNKKNKSSLTKILKAVLESEIHAIENYKKYLDQQEVYDQLSLIIDSIVKANEYNRVILTGAGKSGYVAMKFSSSLASIGISSFYFHPFEAFHGDLGRIKKNDIVILLSNSGETSEIIKIIPYLQQLDCISVALTGFQNSTLAKRCTYKIVYGAVSEAPPLSLAPTSSTTLMMAICDMVLMGICDQKGISSDHFGEFHPGGSIGKSLLKVSDFMRVKDYVCLVREDELVREVIHKYMNTPGRPGAATIVDGNGILKGIFTDGDLRRNIENRVEFLDKPISEFMTKNPKTVSPDLLAKDCLSLINQFEIDQIIVVDDKNKCLGLIDIQDLVRIYVSNDS